MPILNQTASIAGVSNNLNLFVMMIAAGAIVIVIVWVLTQFKKS